MLGRRTMCKMTGSKYYRENKYRSICRKESKRSKPSVSVKDFQLMMLRNQEFCDVKFIVGKDKVEIKCHKLFLTRSPVFKAQYSERWNSGSNTSPEEMTTVVLADEDPKTVQAFIEYLYTDDLNGDIDDILSIVPLADYYSVESLLDKCSEVLVKKLKYGDKDACLKIYRTGVRYNLQHAIRRTESYVIRCIERMSKQPSFGNLDESTWIKLLQSNDFDVEEVKLFRIVLKWAKIQKNNNAAYEGQDEREILQNLIGYIHFPTIDKESFTKHVLPSDILSVAEVANLLKYYDSNVPARIKLHEKLPFPKVFRGKEVLLQLFSHRTDWETAPNVTGEYKETLSFQILYDLDVGEGDCESGRIFMITELLLRGPEIGNDGNFIQEFDTNIVISQCVNRTKKKKLNFRMKLKVGDEYLYKLEPKNIFPLYANKSYNISLSFDMQSAVPERSRLENLYTGVEFSFKVKGCSNVRLSKLRSNSCVRSNHALKHKDKKGSSKSKLAFNVVRGLKLGYF